MSTSNNKTVIATSLAAKVKAARLAESKVESKTELKVEPKSRQTIQDEMDRLKMELENIDAKETKGEVKRATKPKTKTELSKELGVLLARLPVDVMWNESDTFVHADSAFLAKTNRPPITRVPRIKIFCWSFDGKLRRARYGCAIYKHETGFVLSQKDRELEVLKLKISAARRYLYSLALHVVVDESAWNMAKKLNRLSARHYLSTFEDGPFAKYNLARAQNAINLAGFKQDLEFEFDDGRYNRMCEKLIKLENECQLEEERLYKRALRVFESEATDLTNHYNLNVAWQAVIKHARRDNVVQIDLADLDDFFYPGWAGKKA